MNVELSEIGEEWTPSLGDRVFPLDLFLHTIAAALQRLFDLVRLGKDTIAAAWDSGIYDAESRVDALAAAPLDESDKKIGA